MYCIRTDLEKTYLIIYIQLLSGEDVVFNGRAHTRPLRRRRVDNIFRLYSIRRQRAVPQCATRLAWEQRYDYVFGVALPASECLGTL